MDLDRPEASLWDGDHIGVRRLWGYYCQYLYMPRLANYGVLSAAVSDGVAKIVWDPETFAFAEAHNESTDEYQGLVAGSHVGVGMSQTAVLVKPGKAREVLDARGEMTEGPPGPDDDDLEPAGPVLPTRFYGRKELDAVRAIRDFSDLINEVATHLQGESARVKITVEVEAISDGYDDRVRRTVSENASQLGFDAHEFEK
jgi:hypothetical protein